MRDQKFVKIFEMARRKPSAMMLHFSNVGSILVRQRWTQSQYNRVSIILKVFEELKLSQKKKRFERTAQVPQDKSKLFTGFGKVNKCSCRRWRINQANFVDLSREKRSNFDFQAIKFKASSVLGKKLVALTMTQQLFRKIRFPAYKQK